MKTWREGKGLGLCVCWKLIDFEVPESVEQALLLRIGAIVLHLGLGALHLYHRR
jgi:hypothetical protein